MDLKNELSDHNNWMKKNAYGKMRGMGRNLDSKPAVWPQKNPFPFLGLNLLISEENSRAKSDHHYRGSAALIMTLKVACGGGALRLGSPRGAKPVTAAASGS